MLANIDIPAILAGIASAVVSSALAGVLLGAGLLFDAMRRHRDNGFDPDIHDPQLDRMVDETFENAPADFAFSWQLLVINLAVSALSGAMTAWLAAPAPILNATIVGVTGTLIGLLFDDSLAAFPPFLRLGAGLTTLPATLAGAWGFVHFISA